MRNPRSPSVFALCCFFALAAAARGQTEPGPLAPPRNGPRAVDVGWSVVTGVTLHPRPGVVLAKAGVEIRDGRIVRILAEGESPAAGARVYDRTGTHVYAGFLDPYVEVDAPAPDKNAPGVHWSTKVTPQRSALEGTGVDAATRTALRKLGFCAAVISPKGGIFLPWQVRPGRAVRPGPGPAAGRVAGLRRGRLSDDRVRHRWRRAPERDRGAAARDRRGHSALGPVSQLAHGRDRAHQADLSRRRVAGSARGRRRRASRAVRPRPACPRALEGRPLRRDRRARRAPRGQARAGIRRSAVILGSGTEFQRLHAIAAQALPMIVPLALHERPRVGSIGEQEAVDLGDLMTWEQAPTNPRRLDAAGLTVALTTSKARDRAKFLESLREAIKNGLTEDRALAMVTTNPASILGANGFGTVEQGQVANLVVSDGPVFAKDSKILEVWIDGRVHDVSPPAGSARGEWNVVIDPPTVADLRIMVGRADRVRVMAGSAGKRAREAKVTKDRITVVTDVVLAQASPGLSTLTAVIEGGTMTGTGTLPNGDSFHWSATRVPGSESRPSVERDGPESRPDSRADEPPKVPEHFGYPFGPYAREKLPEQPETVLFAGATVWTSGNDGIIENGYVLVSRGKIVAVGGAQPSDLPAGTVVLDVKGKHVTPGLIDCHSHTGISRGVNEGGQAVSAEVRIEDVTDPDAIAWYRELAGGITTVNSLHGSANAIGGQNCINKARWGVTHPDEMHFEDAAPGIKFALGENPKQSNAGDRSTTRYPQTRMGVEALIRDRFVAAREYAAAWRAFEDGGRKGVGPRRDLELEALAEVLSGRRLVHCHSYRQDEILMLCRIAKEFGFTIGTFQHVLEGYKVADEIKAVALGASSFSDWWAYKVEVQDAIPQNGPIMHDVGVVVSFNSDSDELARRMNTEAAKAVKYGGLGKAEALKFVTLNAAKQLKIDGRVGSLEPGKDADIAVWSADPLSTCAKCEQTWIDGRRYFSLEEDAAARKVIAAERQRIIQKILDASRAGRAEGEGGDPTATDDEGSRGRRGRPGWLDGYRSGSDDQGMKPGDCGCGREEDDR